MKKMIILLAVLLCSLSGFAYDDMGSYFGCHNCSDCAAALNNNTYNEVHLVDDISNHAGDCIYDPENFTNKFFDCSGHAIDGDKSGTDFAIYLNSKDNNTIRNCIVTEFYYGIYLRASKNNTITNNFVINNSEGIALYQSADNNTIANNTLNDNSEHGIYLTYSSDNIVFNNTANNNRYGISLEASNNIIINNTANNNLVYGILLSKPNNVLKNNTINNNSNQNFRVEGNQISDFYHDIDTSNKINGKPIYYWTNEKNAPNNCKDAQITEIDDPGFVALISCTNITVKNLVISENYDGLLLVNTSGSKVLNVTVHNITEAGIWLFNSSNNSLTDVTVFDSSDGIWLDYSAYNNLTNVIANNNSYGIEIDDSDNNTLINITADYNFYYGIYLSVSDDNLLKNIQVNNNGDTGVSVSESDGNTFINITAINNSIYGIYLSESSYKSLSGITANNNQYGIYLDGGTFNNTINNTATNNSIFDFSCVGSNCSAVNLNIGFPVSLDGTNFKMKKGASLGNDLERGVRYLNITNSSATNAWVFINISYPENEDASKLFLARWNNSAWETDVSKFTSAHGINSAEKYYYANITKFSLFVLFTEQAPTISLELSSSSIYVGNSITASCSATDGSGVASVSVTSSDGTAICSGTSSCSGTYKPSSVGTKTITCTATDNRGNEGSSSATLTVYSPSSKSVSSVSSISSIQASASTNRVSAGQSVSYNLSVAPNLPLITVSVTFVNALSGISLTASKIAAPPADAPAVPGIPFAYVKVEKNGFKDSDLSSTTLDFKVEKTWIDENEIDPAKVSAYRLENNTWTMLTTTKSTEDDKYIYYSAVSPSGLSIFAISGEKKTAAPPSEEKPPAAAEESAKPGVDYTWIIIAVIVLIITGGVYYYLTSKKSAKK